ncbi:hypothetical protein [Nocardia sp. CA-120079]|uniref:hypothetical protein n=1 Tax=Nocardia sp. CA-120079 TaxID=3239974 RepID=UPI003D973BA2
MIAADNTGSGTVRTLDAARKALADGSAASAGGRLVDELLGADIDAEDPLVGDACAEALIAWCDAHGLPYILRDSGRPGGRHIVAVITNHAVPHKEWAKLCRRLSRLYRVVVDDRTGKVLRLLTAPHRVGLSSSVIACTITPAAVMDAIARRAGKSAAKARRARRTAVVGDSSRSAQEYGHACALARRGVSAAEAWTEIAAAAGKAAELGKAWFQRYVWLPAVTTVAAENGLDEDAAWELAQTACPSVRSRGRDFWRYWWRKASAEASVDRPRRYRLPEDPEAAEAALAPEVAAELDAHRDGLRLAVDALTGIDPRRRHSLHCAVHAVAYAIVTRDGSMSSRTISEHARIARSTTLTALDVAVTRGVLVVTHRYAGGATDCAAYGPGPAATDYISAARNISPTTRCTTPAPHGSASLTHLRATHSKDRRAWSLRCDALASLAPGERLATSQHPAAKLLRSLWFQRRWWSSLTAEEQAERRTQRREHLGTLHKSVRSAWFTWLAEREDIAAAAVRISATEPGPGDVQTVLGAPLTIHRGLAESGWREGRSLPAAA